MKTSPLQIVACPGFFAILLLVVAAPMSRAQAPATPAVTPRPGPPKVRIIARENNVATMAGSGNAATPAATPKKSKATPGAGQPPGPAPAPSADEAERYTRTTKKSLSLAVVNLTAAPMDVTVKTTFLAKDEVGKHEMLAEKTLENKLTLQPAKASEFTTEEVSFTHTAAHLGPRPTPAGGGKTAGKGIAPMIPASGHAYFGYKVEVFEGNDLVGTAANDAH